jgi:hypothetical protein
MTGLVSGTYDCQDGVAERKQVVCQKWSTVGQQPRWNSVSSQGPRRTPYESSEMKPDNGRVNKGQ